MLVVVLTGVPRQDAQVQILVYGVIKKVDVKAAVITVTERVYPDRRGRRGPPSPDLGPGFPPPGPRGARGVNQIETKILYSTDTAIKSEDNKLSLSDLKAGDSVRISGTPSNKGLLAREIERIKAAK